MPFDSFMTSAITSELKQSLLDKKIDKICQPEKDEIDLIFHGLLRNRLVINCAASSPFIALSDQTKENPIAPPMMCMLLRKHLSRAKVKNIEQVGFDRIIKITLESGDDLGFIRKKYLYCEMMGRGSNLVFVDENNRILMSFYQNDITTKFDRVVMVGVEYQPMPTGERINPLTCEKKQFMDVISSSIGRCDLILQKRFLGFGKLTAREVVYLSSGDPESAVDALDFEKLWENFSLVVNRVKEEKFEPCLIFSSNSENGDALFDFSFMPITHLGDGFFQKRCESVSETVENFYQKRNLEERRRQHYNDIFQILKTCKNRLEKKISVLEQQIVDSEDADQDKLFGDLIMQELYRIKKGDKILSAYDYSTDPPVTRSIKLDPVRTPSQNAQKYYREYNKKKTSVLKAKEQIEIAQRELQYAESVLATLDNAMTSTDLAQIRQELSFWNYGRRLLSSLKKPSKRKEKIKPKTVTLPSGFMMYVGLNNLQNDEVSTVIAEKDDLWFHVKNYHGSHVLLKARKDMDFLDSDIEYAAGVAAYYSEVRESKRVEVDYTKARFIKKPGGSNPGFISYKNHYSMIVDPKPLN